MKYFILSDIHGSAYYFKKAMIQFDALHCDKLLLLGDLLYHGPRNDLPHGFDVKTLVNLFNERKEQILAIQGNCDAEVDQMVLSFPLNKELIIKENKRTLYLTHGHHLKEIDFSNLSKNSLILYGHTHIPTFYMKEDLYYFNPGSISLPKENNKHTFGIYEENHLYLYDEDGNLLHQYTL